MYNRRLVSTCVYVLAGVRLERWAVFLRAFDYTIQHVEGDANVWADLLSRWGAGTPAATAARERLASVRMQLLPHRVVPAINSEVPVEESWPSLAEIAATNIPRLVREKYRLVQRNDGCWVTPRGCIFVQNATMRQRLLSRTQVPPDIGASALPRSIWRAISFGTHYVSMYEPLYTAACYVLKHVAGNCSVPISSCISNTPSLRVR